MRWYKAFITVIATIFFTGCAIDQASTAIENKKTTAEQNITSTHNIEKQTIEESLHTINPKIDNNLSQANALIMSALNALDERESEDALKYFKNLFSLTKQKEYLIEIVKILSALNKNEEAIKTIEEYLKQDQNNTQIRRLLVGHYLQLKDIKQATEVAIQVAKESKEFDDYEMVANLYIFQNDHTNAIKYLKNAYSIKPDEIILDKMAVILFVNKNKKQEAISLYETHIRLYGCSRLLCERVASAYKETGNSKQTIEIYKKLYFKYKEESYLKKTTELYLSTQQIDGLIEFLVKSKMDEKTLLEAYKYKHDYKNGAKLALKLYKKTKNSDYLAQSAIFTFEASNKKTKDAQKAIDDLLLALKTVENDIYENYVGYLMIDYNLDLQNGISWVQKALAKKPDTSYYLDSLAWGYYKQKRCKEAFETIKRIPLEIKDDKTIKEHFDAIERCLKK